MKIWKFHEFTLNKETFQGNFLDVNTYDGHYVDTQRVQNIISSFQSYYQIGEIQFRLIRDIQIVKMSCRIIVNFILYLNFRR